MKKVKVALVISLLAFIALLVVYIMSVQAEKPVIVSQRELYQQELRNKENPDM